MSPKDPVEAFFERRRYVLDIAGLSESERREGSILLGGSQAKFIESVDTSSVNQIHMIVFQWGDTKAEEMFAVLLEHNDAPRADIFPFSPSTIIGDEVWSLALQEKKFDPEQVYRSDDDYVVLPFDEDAARQSLQEYLSLPWPKPELLGKVGPRWVAFETGTRIR